MRDTDNGKKTWGKKMVKWRRERENENDEQESNTGLGTP